MDSKRLKKLLGEDISCPTGLKSCPICGSAPQLDIVDLDGGNGHGYPGCYWYSYVCPGCEIIKADAHFVDTTAKKDSRESALKAATKNWNELVDTVNLLIDKTRNAIKN